MPEVRDTRRVKGARGALVAPSPRVAGLAWDGRDYFTKSAGGAARVYGEVVRKDEAGSPWRRWDPQRSKLAAALHRGGLTAPLEALLTTGPMLYLGAASGTTVSHVADVVAPQAVFAVESAGRSFGDLLSKLRTWPNVFPLHADARSPAAYAAMVGTALSIVQDVAQPDQVAILAANARAVLGPRAPGALFVKSRSVDSAADPGRVFADARAQLNAAGFQVAEERGLEPFDLDHRAFFVRSPV